MPTGPLCPSGGASSDVGPDSRVVGDRHGDRAVIGRRYATALLRTSPPADAGRHAQGPEHQPHCLLPVVTRSAYRDSHDDAQGAPRGPVEARKHPCPGHRDCQEQGPDAIEARPETRCRDRGNNHKQDSGRRTTWLRTFSIKTFTASAP